MTTDVLNMKHVLHVQRERLRTELTAGLCLSSHADIDLQSIDEAARQSVVSRLHQFASEHLVEVECGCCQLFTGQVRAGRFLRLKGGYRGYLAA